MAENGEQLGEPAEDGAHLGEAYGLGPCTRILKARRSSWPDTAAALLGWLGGSTLLLAPAVASGISLGPYTAAAKVTADIVAACLLLLVALLAWRALPARRDQMFWYPCGATDHPFRDGSSLGSAFTYFPACCHVCVRAKHDLSPPIRADRSRTARLAPVLAHLTRTSPHPASSGNHWGGSGTGAVPR